MLRKRRAEIMLSIKTSFTEKKMMRNFLLAAAVMLSSGQAHAADGGGDAKMTIMSTMRTPSGLSIALPKNDVRLIATVLELSSGDKIPQSRHPYSRYAYLLSGALQMTNTRTGKVEVYRPGDLIVFDYYVEGVGRWREGVGIGAEAVKLLVIDQIDAKPSSVAVR